MIEKNIHNFLDELDAGIFNNKIAQALSDVAFEVISHNKKGKVTIEFSLEKINSDNPSVKIEHKISYVKPTKRGKSSEEDTTTTPMYVHKGGVLSIKPEKIDNKKFKRDEENSIIQHSVN